MAKPSYDARELAASAFIKKLPHVAMALSALEPGKGWTIETRGEGDHYFVFNADDGDSVGLYLDTYDGRASFSGVYGMVPDGSQWHPSKYSDVQSPTATVSFDRAPEAIAQEIARRILPDYRKCRAAYLTQVARTKAHIKLTEDTYQVICAASGGLFEAQPRREHNRDFSQRETSCYQEGGILHGSLKVSGDRVTLDVHMGAEVATYLLTALAAYRKGEK